ncbi:MAG: uridine kinase [Nocardioidaceae bacterium]|nr:uridine kinase [Nocardioidaceae bacterium]
MVDPGAVLGAAVPAATVLAPPLTPEDDVPGEHAVAAVTTRMATGSRRTTSSWTTEPDKRLVMTRVGAGLVPARHDEPVEAKVIVLAGPSGSGKSHLAERLGLPILRLDDFYREGADPLLPRITSGANAGLVDWDDPDSWLGSEAVAALSALCRTGSVETPVYSISANGRTGTRTLSLSGAPLVVAEGIFAHHVVAPLRSAGLLAAAYCLRQHPMVTFWRRLSRDLREHRKPPLVLLRRGIALMRDQRRIVAEAVAAGCTAVSADEAFGLVQRLPVSR